MPQEDTQAKFYVTAALLTATLIISGGFYIAAAAFLINAFGRCGGPGGW